MPPPAGRTRRCVVRTVGIGAVTPPSDARQLRTVTAAGTPLPGCPVRTDMTVLLDRYELGAPLGTGGMSRVVAAYDHRLQRPVAVKLLRDELFSSPTASQRLIREARSAARLDHPNTVSVFDAGEHDGQPFIVMELVEGDSLAERIHTRGALPASEAVAVLAPVLDALACAHELGMVHRDVKPSNVLLPHHADVKLADFGIAADLGGGSQTLTGSGELLGSPRYLAPERVSGEPATPAADVYAVGITLYETLSGRVPFAGASPIATAIAHQQQPVPPLCEAAADVPPALVRVVEQALAKRPADRFDSARSMHTALTAAGDDAATADHAPAPEHDPPTIVVPGAPAAATVATSYLDGRFDPTDDAPDGTRRVPAAADSHRRTPRWLVATLIVAVLVAGLAGFSLGGANDPGVQDRVAGTDPSADDAAGTDPQAGAVGDAQLDGQATTRGADEAGALGVDPLEEGILDRDTALAELDELIRALDDSVSDDQAAGRGSAEAIKGLGEELRDVRDEDDWADQREEARELIAEVGVWHHDGELGSPVAAHTSQVLEALQRPERASLQDASRLFAEVAGSAPSWGDAEELLERLEALLDDEADPAELRETADELLEQADVWVDEGRLEPQRAQQIREALSPLEV